jgi:hypothetical protein
LIVTNEPATPTFSLRAAPTLIVSLPLTFFRVVGAGLDRVVLIDRLRPAAVNRHAPVPASKVVGR